jgi:hypothetical protein
MGLQWVITYATVSIYGYTVGMRRGSENISAK